MKHLWHWNGNQILATFCCSLSHCNRSTEKELFGKCQAMICQLFVWRTQWKWPFYNCTKQIATIYKTAKKKPTDFNPWPLKERVISWLCLDYRGHDSLDYKVHDCLDCNVTKLSGLQYTWLFGLQWTRCLDYNVHDVWITKYMVFWIAMYTVVWITIYMMSGLQRTWCLDYSIEVYI